MPYPRVRLLLFLALGVLPAYWLYQAWTFALGPDPGKVLLLNLGQGALILLLATLSLSPLQRLGGVRWAAFRRQLGLWVFAYASLHVLCYLVFILGFDWAQLGSELRRRPYILVGMLALICLFPLALTSNRMAMRRLGQGWKKLHRLIYVTAVLVLIHMLWVVRSDLEEWSIYAVWFALLMVARLLFLNGAPRHQKGLRRTQETNSK